MLTYIILHLSNSNSFANFDYQKCRLIFSFTFLILLPLSIVTIKNVQSQYLLSPWIYFLQELLLFIILIHIILAQLAGTPEYPDYISAEGWDSPNECPIYDTKQSDGDVSVLLELWGTLSVIAIATGSTLVGSCSIW